MPGRVGDVDVKDVLQATKAVEKTANVSDVLLFGGSHGGFIIGHLAGSLLQAESGLPSDF